MADQLKSTGDKTIRTMRSALVLVCLASFVSGRGIQETSDMEGSTLKDYDIHPNTETVNQIMISHIQELLAQVKTSCPTEQKSGIHEGKVFCSESVRVKYASCRVICERMNYWERVQCKTVMFSRLMTRCFTNTIDCYGEAEVTTVKPEVTTRPPRVTTTSPSQPGNCGRSPEGTLRIAGGTAVTQNNLYPWQVGLSLSTGTSGTTGPLDYVCSGSIITKRHILTAASCFRDNEIYTIGFGSADETSPAFRGDQKKVTVHEKFNRVTFDYNIAIIELDTPIDFEKRSLLPVCLPGNDNDVDKVTATVSGWGGRTIGTGTCPTAGQQCRECDAITGQSRCLCPIGQECPASSDCTDVANCATLTCTAATCPCGPGFDCQTPPQITQLRQVQVQIDDCPLGESKYTDNMLCTTTNTPARDACQGDAGGPLIIDTDGTFEQIGLVSFGEGCSDDGGSGVYVKISKFIDWINANVGSERTFMI